ncbi:MAG TPA: reverse transcriptase domain-containing protein [Fibrobacteraceae bacterium]|nr:reverse transcriptase domain-containing protein [Fibrobacteraceae bacterium]
MPQKSDKTERVENRQGEAHAGLRRVEAQTAEKERVSSGKAIQMESVLERGNLLEALKRVKQNKGSPCVDGMTVDGMYTYLRENWAAIREPLVAGIYRPNPVKRVMIPKKGGGVRELGIPAVIDRFIQQALLQILQPTSDPTFSPNSYGVRPGRSVHQAVRAAPQAMDKMKENVRLNTGRNGGRSIENVVKELGRYLPGWKNDLSGTARPARPGVDRPQDRRQLPPMVA